MTVAKNRAQHATQGQPVHGARGGSNLVCLSAQLHLFAPALCCHGILLRTSRITRGRRAVAYGYSAGEQRKAGFAAMPDRPGTNRRSQFAMLSAIATQRSWARPNLLLRHFVHRVAERRLQLVGVRDLRSRVRWTDSAACLRPVPTEPMVAELLGCCALNHEAHTWAVRAVQRRRCGTHSSKGHEPASTLRRPKRAAAQETTEDPRRPTG